MSEKEAKKFQSGQQVLRKYIPGYKPRQPEESDYGYPRKPERSPRKIAVSIIRPFVEEISKALNN